MYYTSRVLIVLLCSIISQLHSQIASVYKGDVPEKDEEKSGVYKVLSWIYTGMAVMELVLIVIVTIVSKLS